MSQSVLRGCAAGRRRSRKAAIVLLADDAAGVATVKYSIQRVAVQDNPAHEQPQVLWPAGVLIVAAGRISALLEMQDSSVENAVRRRRDPGLRPQHDHRPDHGPPAGQPAQRRHRAVDRLHVLRDWTRRPTSPAQLREARAGAGERRAHRAEHRPAAVFRQPAPWGSRTAPGSSNSWPTIRAVRRLRSTSSAATSPRPRRPASTPSTSRDGQRRMSWISAA